MSTSPTGVAKFRARIRKPLAVRKRAACDSPLRPSRISWSVSLRCSPAPFAAPLSSPAAPAVRPLNKVEIRSQMAIADRESKHRRARPQASDTRNLRPAGASMRVRSTTMSVTTKPTPLPVIEVATPCPADWDAMTGDDRRRFCAHCQCHVHDLSAMRSAEVLDLICRNAGQLCVQFERAADGQVKTLDYQPASAARPRWRYHWIIVGVLAAVGATVGRAAWQQEQQSRMRGAMVPMRVPSEPVAASCPTE